MTTTPIRAQFWLDGRRISYVDFGGPGRPLLALHGHLEEGMTWAGLAQELAPQWRIIAPDQRGHGDSDRVGDYSPQAYVSDAVAVIERLGLGQVAVLGHSGRGLTAYQLASRRPDLLSAVIVEEAGAVIGVPGGPSALSFCLAWPHRADTRRELLDGLGPAAPMFAEALRQLPEGGWRLPFVPQDMVDSELQVRGDHWDDWLAVPCPVLLLVGNRQPCVDADHAAQMAASLPGTRLVTLDTDHFVHKGDPRGMAAAIREFLA